MMFEPRRASITATDQSLFRYLLHLADSPLVLSQRLGEWVGKGPVLEEDLALTNVALDLLGQARLWYAYASEVEPRYCDKGRSEDELAFLRDAFEFRNLLIVELPNGHYGYTIARQFLFDVWHALVLNALTQSSDERIAGIAAKASKETAYHVDRSAAWVIRLGDGTDQSHTRMQAAVDAIWMYTGEMFTPDATELALVDAGVAADVRTLHDEWQRSVSAVLAEGTLTVPEQRWMQGSRGRGGKAGVHTEHLGHLLAEMQFLQRAYPAMRW